METLSNKIVSRAVLFLLLFASALLLLGGRGFVWAENNDFNLTILHTNDVHARIMRFDKNGVTCPERESQAMECFGGMARLATKINEIRNRGGNAILVDAGDQFQGTLFFTHYKGKAIQGFMNRLGYQAMVVGNHEFDAGPEVLADFIKGVKFPVLGANLDVSKEPHLDNLIKPYTILVVGGESIGVLGYTVENIAQLSNVGPNVTARPVQASIAGVLEVFKQLRVDKIVALSHAGLDFDKEIASKIDGIDVIVGGHTHTFLANSDPAAQGPYPIIERSPNGNPVLIVTDFAWGKYLGKLDVTFDANGVVKAWSGEPILLDWNVPDDPNISAEVQKLMEPLVAMEKEIVGVSQVDLDGGMSCRFEECSLGDLITDAMISATAANGTQIAFQNGGGIRASIPRGQISRGQILEVLPFGNSLCTLQLKGADVLVALENAVSRADGKQTQGTGRFLQVSGLRYTWDPKKPVGSRLVKVEVRTSDGSYQMIRTEVIYNVAVNDFLRRGGDGYEVFANKAIGSQDGPIMEEVLIEYIKNHSPLKIEREGRISRISGYQP